MPNKEPLKGSSQSSDCLQRATRLRSRHSPLWKMLLEVKPEPASSVGNHHTKVRSVTITQP